MPTVPTQPDDGHRFLRASGGRRALVRLGNRLRRARLQARLTQAQAAEVVGNTTQTLRNWETARNEPPVWAIKKLAERYNVTEESLLEGLNDPLDPPRLPQRFPYDRVMVDGNKLSSARIDAGFSQVRVSYMTGLHPKAISRYEKDISNPAARTLQVLASLYDMPAGWFTPRGHFTEEEQQIFDASTTLRINPDSGTDLVLGTYMIARPDLTEEAKQQINNFIVFIHRQLMTSQKLSVRRTPGENSP